MGLESYKYQLVVMRQFHLALSIESGDLKFECMMNKASSKVSLFFLLTGLKAVICWRR